MRVTRQGRRAGGTGPAGPSGGAGRRVAGRRAGRPGATTGMSSRAGSSTSAAAPMRSRKPRYSCSSAGTRAGRCRPRGRRAGRTRSGRQAAAGARAGSPGAPRRRSRGRRPCPARPPPITTHPRAAVGGSPGRSRRTPRSGPARPPAAFSRPGSDMRPRSTAGRVALDARPAAGGRCRPWPPCTPGSASRAWAASARPRSYHSSARAASKVIRASEPVVGPARSVGHPESGPVLGRQVHPAHLVPVLDDVAQDVGDLEGDPEGVGQRLGSLRVDGPVHGQAEPADGARHPPAVADQLVEVAVLRALDVHLAAVDQLVARRRGGSGSGRTTSARATRTASSLACDDTAGQAVEVLADAGQGVQLRRGGARRRRRCHRYGGPWRTARSWPGAWAAATA